MAKKSQPKRRSPRITFTLNLPPDLRAWLASKADDEERPAGYVLRRIITDAKRREQQAVEATD